MIHIVKRENDKLLWKFSTTCEVSNKLMYQHYVNHGVVQDWLYKVWNHYISPLCFFLW